MDDLNIIKDEDIRTINLDLNTPVADSSGTLGIELLADPKKTNKPDGYTSGEESRPSSPKKEFNLSCLRVSTKYPRSSPNTLGSHKTTSGMFNLLKFIRFLLRVVLNIAHTHSFLKALQVSKVDLWGCIPFQML